MALGAATSDHKASAGAELVAKVACRSGSHRATSANSRSKTAFSGSRKRGWRSMTHRVPMAWPAGVRKAKPA